MLKRILTTQSSCGCGVSVLKSYRPCSSTTSASQKFLNVAILGSPNAGKSTLVNNMVGNRVSAVTHVANTTRTHANGILNIGDTQLVFTDTPGVISYEEGRRLKMHKNHIRTPGRVALFSDLLAVVADASNKRTKNYIHEEVLKIMEECEHIPVVLVLNKIDQLKHKEQLLTLATSLTEDRRKDRYGYVLHGGSSRFAQVFFTSAKTGDGVDQFLDYLLSQAKPKSWEYPPGIFCDSSNEALIAEVFRETLLVMYGTTIPWQVKQQTVIFKSDEEGGVTRLHQKLTWPKNSQVKFVLQKELEFTQKCLEELEILLDSHVDLTIDFNQKSNMIKDDLLYY